MKELRIFDELKKGDVFFDVVSGDKYMKTDVVPLVGERRVKDHVFSHVDCVNLESGGLACSQRKEAVHVEVKANEL